MFTLRISLIVALAIGCFASPGITCSVTGIATPAELLQKAEAIVRARAERLSVQPGQGGSMADGRTQVLFTILEVLKGPPMASTIEFTGLTPY